MCIFKTDTCVGNASLPVTKKEIAPIKMQEINPNSESKKLAHAKTVDMVPTLSIHKNNQSVDQMITKRS